MPNHVHIQESIVVKISKDKLWDITALQFDKIGDWSAGVIHSEGHGTSQLGAVCLERQCNPSYKGFKKTTERIIEYLPDNYQFTYKIIEGLPGMVQNATNTWTHVGDENQTTITMDVNMHLTGFMGWVMKTPMKKQMRKILRENLEELKVFAETGQVHDRKKSV
ncbi:MAG: SRPBCC family protein [Bacteroidota bacterium]